MEQLIELLNEIAPGIDYETVDNLIEGKILDSFTIVSLIDSICEEFDIEISPRYLIPENFNSAKAIWRLIQLIQDEE